MIVMILSLVASGPPFPVRHGLFYSSIFCLFYFYNTQKEEPQELPPEVNSSVPMVMPVSVPVKPPSAPVRFSSTPQIPEMSGDPEDLASLYPRAVCSQRPMSPYVSNTSLKPGVTFGLFMHLVLFLF